MGPRHWCRGIHPRLDRLPWTIRFNGAAALVPRNDTLLAKSRSCCSLGFNAENKKGSGVLTVCLSTQRLPTPFYSSWHLLLWPRHDGELSEVLRWITVTHTQRWHAHHHTAGTGPVYQGRFKSFPVQTDEHFLMVARYVERNALRAKLVKRAEDWRWSSLWRRDQGDGKLTMWLSDWPVDRPRDWVARVNRPQGASELDALRLSVQRGRPFGDEGWVRRMVKRFAMESTLRPRERPKGS